MKKVHHSGKTGHGESSAKRSGSCAEDCVRRADVQRGLEKDERGGGGSFEAAAAPRASFQQTTLRERLDPRVEEADQLHRLLFLIPHLLELEQGGKRFAIHP